MDDLQELQNMLGLQNIPPVKYAVWVSLLDEEDMECVDDSSEASLVAARGIEDGDKAQELADAITAMRKGMDLPGHAYVVFSS